MNVTLFGTGYVGLVTGACLAEVGHQVLCLDIDEEKIAGLRAGRIPIFEPGLEPLVAANQAAGRLRFATDPAEGLAHAEIVFIAVGTPPREDGSADLSHVLDVARDIGRHVSRPTLVVGKSTVPVGTADRVRAAIEAELIARGLEIPVEVVSNPEFLKEGDAVNDCLRPDRIIIGSRDSAAIETLTRLYAPFNRNHQRIVTMDTRSAELTKYAANAMLATKISFMNEMANIAERVGADIEMVRQGIGSDPRIGTHFIYPGAGYGGSCFPKDVQALLHTADSHGYRPRLMAAVDSVNEAQKGKLFDLIQKHFQGQISGLVFALWGLAFKPNTDDIRCAPSITLIRQLLDAGASVRAFDPEATGEMSALIPPAPGMHYCQSQFEAVDGADALVLITEWKAFWNPDFASLRTRLRETVVFDGRNVYDPDEVERTGLRYYGIGRGRSIQGDDSR
ncbi:MAG: UDP-glucose/GDP-mannose dehydrogenase family protein [Xanthomonadaceae bacterium]|nr:UDP-glucose/GDP-mannose dehydrogenase family protein [Xanthomonadaceae bacterium]